MKNIIYFDTSALVKLYYNIRYSISKYTKRNEYRIYKS